ncbi:MAG: DUF2391 domain-containing protein [Halanaeroarchaeum sp.]
MSEDDRGDATVEDLIDELEDIEDAVADPASRERVTGAIETARRVDTSPVFGQVIRGFDRADFTEAVVGSLLVGVPLFMEGATVDVAAHLATNPLAMVATVAIVAVVTVGVVYVADIQDVRVQRAYFGVVPRRLVGVVVAAVLTAVVVMTLWGRIEWSTPWIALNRVLVALVPMSLGTALGDILPGS